LEVVYLSAYHASKSCSKTPAISYILMNGNIFEQNKEIRKMIKIYKHRFGNKSRQGL
jgi:flagellar biosynthesis regulator FlbT